MKKTTAIMIAIGLTGASAAGFAQTIDIYVSADVVGVARTDSQENSDRLFAKIDLDRDGSISVDEYAAQAIVRASLARYNGQIIVEADEEIVVSLPTEAHQIMTAREQTVIDALARSEYYDLGGSTSGLSKQAWIRAQDRAFLNADDDRDDVLTGSELDVFALGVARYRITYG